MDNSNYDTMDIIIIIEIFFWERKYFKDIHDKDADGNDDYCYSVHN